GGVGGGGGGGGEGGRKGRGERAADWEREPVKNVGVHYDEELSSTEENRRESAWREAPVILETHGVSKRFGGIVAASELDIQLRRGTITALVGPHGAGKTTVFNLLTGAIPPASGSIL